MVRAASAAVAATPETVLPLASVTLRQNTASPRPGCRWCGTRLAAMAGPDPADAIAALKSTLASVEAVLDPAAMEREAASLREQAADPELWADQDRAQQVTRRLSYLEAELNRLTALHSR